MLEFLTHVSALARQGVLPGFIEPNEGTEREGVRAAPAPYVEFIDGPYQIISDKRQIMNLLQQVLETRRPVSLTARRSVRTADTRLMSIDAARGRILLRQLINDASHSQLLLDGRVNITARYNNVPLMFTLELMGSRSFDGIPCYIAPIPDWILFAQMRDSFRIHLPRTLDARLRFHVAAIGPVEAKVLDISESGVGALIPEGLSRAMAANDTFLDASVSSHDGNLSPLRFTLRYVGSALGGPQRIGAALDLPTESLRQNLRRLILRHQPLRARTN
ncbi:MAG: flagellar brake protein [Betaproteobacteria bacterium]|nr:flagellar brake protein [Betaproteobacteria bacterium]